MPRVAQRSISSSMQGGLVSQATPLTRSSTDQQALSNMVPDQTGHKRRRKGVALESDFTLLTQNPLDAVEANQVGYAYAKHEWDSVGNDPDLNLLAVQWGNELVFVVRDGANNSLSGSPKQGLRVRAVDLRLFINTKGTANDVVTTPVSMVAGNGDLFVSSKFVYPFRVAWTGEDFEATTVSPVIRDFRLADDNLGVGERPAVTSPAHDYNLANHGWPATAVAAFLAAPGAVYPSNADIYHEGLITDPGSGSEVFNPTTITALAFGNAPAPAGHYLYDAHSPGYSWSDVADQTIIGIVRSSANPDDVKVSVADTSALSVGSRVFINGVFATADTTTVEHSPMRLGGVYEVAEVVGATQVRIVVDSTLDGFIGNFLYAGGGTLLGPLIVRPGVTGDMFSPAAIGFYSRRLWFGNTTSPNKAEVTGEFQSSIYFSEVIKDDRSYSKCHQIGDPTAQFRNSLVPTDGGAIPVGDVGLCTGFSTVGLFNIVYSSNGVWGLSGVDNSTFDADAFSLDKKSVVGLSSQQSIVLVEEVAFFWSDQGVYSISLNNQGTALGVGSITVESIQPTYNLITDAELRTSAGVYESLSKQVIWFYGMGKGLIFDLKNQAWHPISVLSSDDQFVVGLAVYKGNVPEENRVKLATRYRLFPADHLTFSEFSDTTFIDWANLPGGDQDFGGFLETSDIHLDIPSLEKDIVSLTSFFLKTERFWSTDSNGDSVLDNPSGATVQAIYNFGDAAVNGAYGPVVDAYNLPDSLGNDPGAPVLTGSSVVVHTTSSSGRGHAVRLRYETKPGKDMQILGWAMNFGVSADEP